MPVTGAGREKRGGAEPASVILASGFMDLDVERLPNCETSGAPAVEALTFEQSISPIYQEVYPEPLKVLPKLKEHLNDFLRENAAGLQPQDGCCRHSGRRPGHARQLPVPPPDEGPAGRSPAGASSCAPALTPPPPPGPSR